jgi:hypothetical protein
MPMFIINEIYRIKTLHRLIQMQNTGTPDELAERLHICRRQLYNILDELKELGAEISYSRNNYTFYYKNDFDINIECNIHCIKKEQEKCIFGGNISENAIIVHGITLSLHT